MRSGVKQNGPWMAALSALLLAACGGSVDSSNADGGEPDAAGEHENDGGEHETDDAASEGDDGVPSDGGASSRDAGGSTGTLDAGRDAGGSTPVGNCLADTLLKALQVDHMLVGASMSDESAKAAPFDARYLYLAGGMFDGERPCQSCASSCNAGGKSCANGAGGCAWWGCWQWDQAAPGAYVRDFATKVTGDGQIPLVTYYEILQAAKLLKPDTQEGASEVAAANDDALMRRYLADFAFMLDQIGSMRALVHIEPDFWAYAQQVNDNPASIPAKVGSVNDECKSYENNFAGLGRCLIHLVRKHAPNARVGFHGSAWATKTDVLGNTDPKLDVAGEARKLANFLKAAGADDSDFVAVDASDRDAAWYKTQGRDTFWDDTNQKLPNFKQAFSWAKALAESMGKPVVWWQVPVGNMQLPNQPNRWKDNRVDYFLDHPGELAASHAAAVLFGAGDGNQTTPESDDGHLITRVKAYAKAPQTPCP